MTLFCPANSSIFLRDPVQCSEIQTRGCACAHSSLFLLIDMPEIDIFDTEVFTGYLVGPLVFGYELELVNLQGSDPETIIKLPIFLSNSSKFMVPLPAEISSSFDATVAIRLNELTTGRSIFTAQVPLGEVFYHDFGTVFLSPQLLLANHAHSPISHRTSLLSTQHCNVIVLMLMLAGAVQVLKSCWKAACRTVKLKPSPKLSRNKHHHQAQPLSAPMKAPSQRTGSLSSLTDSDKETDKEIGSSYNSLQEPPPLQAHHVTRRLHRRRKESGGVNTFEDRDCLGSGCWDPFASSSW